MIEPTSIRERPSDWLESVLLLVVLLLIVLRLGPSTSKRPAVAAGSIRLGPPALVPLGGEERAIATRLLGGVITAYLADSDEGGTP